MSAGRRVCCVMINAVLRYCRPPPIFSDLAPVPGWQRTREGRSGSRHLERLCQMSPADPAAGGARRVLLPDSSELSTAVISIDKNPASKFKHHTDKRSPTRRLVLVSEYHMVNSDCDHQRNADQRSRSIREVEDQRCDEREKKISV